MTGKRCYIICAVQTKVRAYRDFSSTDAILTVDVILITSIKMEDKTKSDVFFQTSAIGLIQLLSWQRLVTWGSGRWARCIDYRATITGNGVTTNPNTNPHRRRHTHGAILLLGNYCKPIEMFLCPSHPPSKLNSVNPKHLPILRGGLSYSNGCTS